MDAAVGQLVDECPLAEELDRPQRSDVLSNSDPPASSGPRAKASGTALLWGRVGSSPSGPVTPEDPAHGLVGHVLDGRYEVVAVLGRGGMGVVFDAIDRQLDRAVVVKVMAPVAPDGAARERLLREARLACRVQHPGIVTIFHTGLLSTGEPFLVMERLDGRDLADLLAERRVLSLEETVALIAPACAALAALHDAGVVHRDIKPENLFVLRDGGARAPVKLIDFGLAILDDASLTRLTRAGRILGTPEYIAPESVGGAVASAASDVYSLACVVHELLLGSPPFSGNALDVFVAKTRSDAPRLAGRGRDPRFAALDPLLARALSRDPAARPSALELEVGLERALEAAPTIPHETLVVADPPVGNERETLAPPDGSSRRAIVLATTAIVIAVVSLVTTIALYVMR